MPLRPNQAPRSEQHAACAPAAAIELLVLFVSACVSVPPTALLLYGCTFKIKAVNTLAWEVLVEYVNG